MATLKDIAAATGVSISTISRILNRDETLSVPPQTQQKVFDAARELGYVATRSRSKNDSSRSGGQRMGIAQMFEMEQVLQDPYYLYMKTALEQVCFSRGLETISMFRDSQGDFAVQGEKTLDGIFAIGSFTSQEIRSFERYTHQIVFVDSTPDDERYFATVPNFHLGLRQALTRFLQEGHQRIGFIGSHYTLQETRDLKLDSRLCYFRNFLQDRGLYQEKYVLDSPMDSPSAFQVLSQALEQWDAPPTALFISSDAMANGVMRALSQAGLSVPKDISLIAFNDTPLSQNTTPPLSSIRVLQHELAVAALGAMDLCRSGVEYPFKTVVPCVYVERGSVAAPSAANQQVPVL